MDSSGQYTRQQAPFTAHPRVSGGPSLNRSTNAHDSSAIVRSQYPTATLGLQALRTSHGMRLPMTSQSGYPYIGTVNGGLFPQHAYMTAPPHPTSNLGVIQKHSISHNANGTYPHLPFASSPFNSLSPPTETHQGQPTNIGNLEYSDVSLDWLSSLAGASHHQYTSTNPTILVSPADGNYPAFNPKAVPEEAATFFAASAAADSDISPIPIHVPRGASGSGSGLGSPFNSLSASLTPTFSSTPSTFDFSTSPVLTQHSPVVPCTSRPLTEEALVGDQGLDLVGLFSRPPSVPCGTFAIERPYSKEVPHAPSGGSLLTVPLATQLTFTDHNRPSEFGIHNTLPSGQVPYATGRKEVRFPNQKKVNVVEDMCRWFPEESQYGKLLKRICATEWYHNGELEPIFGHRSQDLTFGLALGFEAGQSILLGFVGNEGKCLYCGHTSAKKDRILAHIREHLGLRPFVCTEERCPCKELPVRPAFSSREALSSHLRNPIRIITCDFCHKSIRSNNFRRHLNARHRDQVQLPERQRAKPRCMSLPA